MEAEGPARNSEAIAVIQVREDGDLKQGGS